MPERTSPLSLTALVGIVALAIGALGGYYVGAQSASRAADAGTQQASENPYANVETNPLGEVKTNPYSDVKVNPFE